MITHFFNTTFFRWSWRVAGRIDAFCDRMWRD